MPQQVGEIPLNVEQNRPFERSQLALHESPVGRCDGGGRVKVVEDKFVGFLAKVASGYRLVVGLVHYLLEGVCAGCYVSPKET